MQLLSEVLASAVGTPAAAACFSKPEFALVPLASREPARRSEGAPFPGALAQRRCGMLELHQSCRKICICLTAAARRRRRLNKRALGALQMRRLAVKSPNELLSSSHPSTLQPLLLPKTAFWAAERSLGLIGAAGSGFRSAAVAQSASRPSPSRPDVFGSPSNVKANPDSVSFPCLYLSLFINNASSFLHQTFDLNFFIISGKTHQPEETEKRQNVLTAARMRFPVHRH